MLSFYQHLKDLLTNTPDGERSEVDSRGHDGTANEHSVADTNTLLEMSTKCHEKALAHRGQCGDPNEVAVRQVIIDMLAQIRSHIGAHVSEGVEGAQGEVQSKAANESKDAIELLFGK